MEPIPAIDRRNVSVGQNDLPEGSRFLQKPYRPEQIVATLRELTGGG